MATRSPAAEQCKREGHAWRWTSLASGKSFSVDPLCDRYGARSTRPCPLGHKWQGCYCRWCGLRRAEGPHTFVGCLCAACKWFNHDWRIVGGSSSAGVASARVLHYRCACGETKTAPAR